MTFLISRGGRKRDTISTVTGKGAKQRAVYLTEGAREAVGDYLQSRTDTSMALFVNYDRASAEKDRRLTAAGARLTAAADVAGTVVDGAVLGAQVTTPEGEVRNIRAHAGVVSGSSTRRAVT